MHDITQRIRVAGLFFHPIKSCAAIPEERLKIEIRGPELDREFMVVDKDGKFMSQRTHPRMCLARPRIEGDYLVVSADGVGRIEIDLRQPGRFSRTVRVWDDECAGLDQGRDAAELFSELLRADCRLVRYHLGRPRRHTSPWLGGEELAVSFADAYPVLVVSESALDGLNAKLESPVPMNRFRPNIVLGGCTPHAEDGWKGFEAGGIRFEFAKLCDRCTVPDVDQATGEQGHGTVKTLSRYRRELLPGKPAAVCFGANYVPRGFGMISVGDEVRPF